MLCHYILYSSAATQTRYTNQNISVKKPDQTCTPLIIAFCVPLVKIKLANSSPLTMVWCARVASVGAIQGSQLGGLDLITLFLLAKHLYLPARNEHPVTSLRTWLGGAFKRQSIVKDKIIKD